MTKSIGGTNVDPAAKRKKIRPWLDTVMGKPREDCIKPISGGKYVQLLYFIIGLDIKKRKKDEIKTTQAPKRSPEWVRQLRLGVLPCVKSGNRCNSSPDYCSKGEYGWTLFPGGVCEESYGKFKAF